MASVVSVSRSPRTVGSGPPPPPPEDVTAAHENWSEVKLDADAASMLHTLFVREGQQCKVCLDPCTVADFLSDASDNIVYDVKAYRLFLHDIDALELRDDFPEFLKEARIEFNNTGLKVASLGDEMFAKVFPSKTPLLVCMSKFRSKYNDRLQREEASSLKAIAASLQRSANSLLCTPFENWPQLMREKYDKWSAAHKGMFQRLVDPMTPKPIRVIPLVSRIETLTAFAPDGEICVEYDCAEPPLGSGTFGVVYKAVFFYRQLPDRPKEECAVKIPTKDGYGSLLREQRILAKTHDNIVGAYNAQEANPKCLVMQLGCRSLSQWVDEMMARTKKWRDANSGRFLSSTHISLLRTVIEGILSGMVEMHKTPNRLFHRDLKCENIQLFWQRGADDGDGDACTFKNIQAKIADFGSCLWETEVTLQPWKWDAGTTPQYCSSTLMEKLKTETDAVHIRDFLTSLDLHAFACVASVVFLAFCGQKAVLPLDRMQFEKLLPDLFKVLPESEALHRIVALICGAFRGMPFHQLSLLKPTTTGEAQIEMFEQRALEQAKKRETMLYFHDGEEKDRSLIQELSLIKFGEHEPISLKGVRPKHAQEKPTPLRALIIGEGGAGKSTLLKSIAGKCSRGEFDWGFRAVVRLRLDKLKDEVGLEQILSLACGWAEPLPPVSYFENHVLFLLDGLDESKGSADTFLDHLSMNQVQGVSHYIITSREICDWKDTFLKRQHHTGIRAFRLVGFTDKMQEEYIDSHFSEKETAEREEMFLHLQRLGEFGRLPVACYWVYRIVKKRSKIQEISLSKLISEVYDMMKERAVASAGHDKTITREKLTLSRTAEKILVSLAFSWICDRRPIVLERENLRIACTDEKLLDACLSELRESGFLREERTTETDSVYEFVHTLVAEFAAAKSVAALLQSEGDGDAAAKSVAERLESVADGDLLAKLWSGGRNSSIFIFLSGLVRNNQVNMGIFSQVALLLLRPDVELHDPERFLSTLPKECLILVEMAAQAPHLRPALTELHPDKIASTLAFFGYMDELKKVCEPHKGLLKEVVLWGIRGDHPAFLTLALECGFEKSRCFFIAAVFRKWKVLNVLLEDPRLDVNFKKSGRTALYWACFDGDLRLVEAVLQKKPLISGLDEPPLCAAAIAGRRDIASLLLEHGADVNEQGKSKHRPLMLAAAKGNVEVTGLLLERRATLVKDRQGISPLTRAALRGYTSVMELFFDPKLGVGVSADEKNGLLVQCASKRSLAHVVQFLLEKSADVQARDMYGYTALMHSVRKKFVSVSKLLVDRNAAVNEKDPLGNPPLSYAALHNHLGLATLLLDAKALVDQKDQFDDTPLHTCASNGAQEMAQMLLASKADPNVPNGGVTPLSRAFSNGHVALMKLLLRHGARISGLDNTGTPILLQCARSGLTEMMTALLEDNRGNVDECDEILGASILSWACTMGHLEIVKLLLSWGANFRYSDKVGNTPFSRAIRAHHAEIVAALLGAGMEVNAKDTVGATGLMWAASIGDLDVLKVLLQAGAAVDEVDALQQTALMRAAGSGKVAVARQLILSKADMNKPSASGTTPLLQAVLRGHVEIVQLFLDPTVDISKTVDVDQADRLGRTSLYLSSRYGNLEIVQALLAKGASLDKLDSWKGSSALSWACTNGHLEIAGLLLKFGAKFSLDNDGVSPLGWAATNGHLEIARLLLNSSAPVNKEDYKGATPLSWACSRGHVDIAKLLLENAANINVKDRHGASPLSWACYSGKTKVVLFLLDQNAEEGTALSWACGNGHLDVVKAFLQHPRKLDVNVKDSEGQTALSRAAGRGHFVVVKRLIQSGANVNDGSTALSWACVGGSLKVVGLLLKQGADIDEKDVDGQTPLARAAGKGHAQVVDLLLQKKAKVNEADPLGKTPLTWACAGGFTEVVGLLLRQGAHINQKDVLEGQTALSRAAGRGHFAVVQRLIESRANVNDGSTPLRWACVGGFTEVVGLLLKQGADIDEKDVEGQTPLARAAGKGHAQVVDLLLQRSAKVNEADSLGNTPLTWASRCNHIAVVKALLGAGAEMMADKTGNTPLTLAAGYGHDKIVRLLLEHGAGIGERDKLGNTALAWAAKNGHLAVVKLLVGKAGNSIMLEQFFGDSLIRACQQGNIGIASLLLASKAKIDKTDADGQTALAWSAGLGHREIVELLLTGNASVSAKDTLGMTPLIHAAGRGQLEVVILLLKSRADVNAVDQTGSTALSRAGVKGHLKILEILRANGASANLDAPLIRACKDGQTGVVNLLLEMRADCNAKDNQTGSTALWWASAGGHADVVEALLVHGARVDDCNIHRSSPLSVGCMQGVVVARRLLAAKASAWTQDVEGNTPLHISSSHANVECVEMLLLLPGGLEGASIRNSLGMTPLIQAAGRGQFEVVRLLLAAKANHEDVDRSGQTALMHAAGMGYDGIVHLLLEEGAILNGRHVQAHSALARAVSLASKGSHFDVLKVLLHHGASVNEKDAWGSPLLHFACSSPRVDLVILLLKNRADVNAVDQTGSTALSRACVKGHLKILEILRANGASSANLDAPLIRACKDGQTGVVNLLLEMRADCNAKDNQTGSTALWWASAGGHADVVEALLVHGARVNDCNIQNNLKRTALDLAHMAGHQQVVGLLLKFGGKRSPCNFFLQGRCARGAQCTFSHVRAEEDSSVNSTEESDTSVGSSSLLSVVAQSSVPATSSNVDASSATSPVRSGVTTSQARRTPGAKRSPCNFFLQGRCAKGAQCPFSHDEK